MIKNRNAARREVEMILDWAADEGWNPGLDDAEVFYAADPDGFFVAVDETGTPVAAISVVNHSAEFAFLGLYLVRPTHRARGIGFSLWKYATEHAKTRTIGLDGVEAQQANYQASGFVHFGGTTRFTGKVAGQRAPEIRPMRQDEVPAAITLEAEASGVRKPAYLQGWFSGTATRITIVFETHGHVRGLCTVRDCRFGPKIGPLIAEDTNVARRLLAHAATYFENSITLDVPGTSTELTRLCRQLGLEAGFKTARMYRGTAVTTTHPNYAVASLELG